MLLHSTTELCLAFLCKRETRRGLELVGNHSMEVRFFLLEPIDDDLNHLCRRTLRR